jgi:hypothetical protein
VIALRGEKTFKEVFNKLCKWKKITKEHIESMKKSLREK